MPEIAAEGQVRVWFSPRVGGTPVFQVGVNDFDDARFTLAVIADYDNFLVANGLKSDDSNMSGVEVFTDGEWLEAEE